MITVILSPINPWLQGDAVQDRLLKYWQSKDEKPAEDRNRQCPFMTVSIEL